ncbi:inositol monophosphatase family protein [Streptomyces sp. NPDC002092]
MKTASTLTGMWHREMEAAIGAARAAAVEIRSDFGNRNVTSRKGFYDVQLRADLVAQRVIVQYLVQRFPDYAVVSEEGMQESWNDRRMTWVVDPLDGTNNFGFGIAHCAVAITLFDEGRPVLAVIHDPILGRQFSAVADSPRQPVVSALSPTMGDATVALVTDYSREGRITGRRIDQVLSQNCKRVTAMWAPALDLALVSTGALDAMVSRNAALLDVCAGLLLVQMAGGCILDTRGVPLRLDKSLHRSAVSFVAASSEKLASDLVRLVFPDGGR